MRARVLTRGVGSSRHDTRRAAGDRGRRKVLFVATVAQTLQQTCLGLSGALQRSGYEVLAASAEDQFVHDLEARGIRHLPVGLSRGLVTPWADLAALRRLRRIFRDERPDIVHTHTLKAGILGRLAARWAGVPVVVHTFHGFVFYDRTRGWKRRLFVHLERLAARCSDLIFSVNREDIETAIVEGIAQHAPIVRLGDGGVGVDLTRFRGRGGGEAARRRIVESLGLPAKAPVVGFVGRLNKGKGLCELFEAIKVVRARRPDVRLLVVGPVDLGRSDFVSPEEARKAGIHDVAVFAGLRRDMPELYAAMDLLALPSHSEGLPLVLLEAAAMGLPSVVTDVRGCREVVRHGQTGLIVPKGDVEALAEAIGWLLDRPLEARRMGEQARLLALERFDERPVFEKVQAEYARLLQAKGIAIPHRVMRPAFEAAG